MLPQLLPRRMIVWGLLCVAVLVGIHSVSVSSKHENESSDAEVQRHRDYRQLQAPLASSAIHRLPTMLVLGAIETLLKGQALNSIPNLSDYNKFILLNQMDVFTVFVVAFFPAALASAPAVPDAYLRTEDIDLGWKRSGEGFDDWEREPPVQQPLLNLPRNNVSISILRDDDIFGNAEDYLMGVIDRLVSLPIVDKTFLLGSDEEGQTMLEELPLVPGLNLPVPHHTWDDATSDESMSRLFFYAYGSVLLQEQSAQTAVADPELGPFVVDVDLSDLTTRPSFRPYGFRIHFDADQKITAIFDYAEDALVRPGDGETWEQAKYLTRTTTVFYITVKHHLLWTHLILSNGMAKASIENIPPSHPIRRLLTVFTFRANAVNNEAQSSLLPNGSWIHRMTGLEHGSFGRLFEAGYEECNIFKPFPDQEMSPELRKLSEDGLFPYHSEGVAYFEVVRAFVREWLELAGPEVIQDEYAKAFYEDMVATAKGQRYELPEMGDTEAMVDLLSQIIFVVTAYHEIVGHVVDYRIPASFAGSRVLKNSTATSADLQDFLLAVSLTGNTGTMMPRLMANFPNYFGAGGAPEWEIGVWANFQESLAAQSEAVQAADANRTTEYKSMDPANFECAVSL